MRWWLLLLAIAAPQPALALERDRVSVEVKKTVARAREAFSAGRFEEAGGLFATAKAQVDAAKLDGAGALAFNAAVSYLNASRCAAAYKILTELARVEPRRAEDEAYRVRLRAAELCAPEVSVASDPPGATVRVDGEILGLTPLGARLDLGDHALEVTREGYVAYKSKANVDGKSHLEPIALQPIALLVAVASDPPPPAAPPPPAGFAPVEPKIEVPLEPARLSPWPFVTGGVAVAAGTAALILKLHADAVFGENCWVIRNACKVPARPAPRETARADANGSYGLETASIGLALGAGVAAVVAGWLFYSELSMSGDGGAVAIAF